MTGRLLIVLISAAAIAAPQPLAFDSASVKPSAGRTPGIGNGPASLSLHRASLKFLISRAFMVPFSSVVGGPAWVESEPYDIDARAGKAASEAEKMEMLRTLLADRFHLQTHSEERSIPSYALTIAKRGARFGAGFHPLQEGETIPESKPGLLIFRGTLKLFARVIDDAISSGRLAPGPGAPPASPPDPLPVVDRTELSGVYVITVDFRQINDWFEVLEPELGLTLTRRKLPARVVVVDSAIRPGD